MNHTFGPLGAVYELAEKFKALVEERSGGKIKVQNNHSGQLGAEKDGYDSLQLGSLDLHITGSLIVATLAPEYQAIDMPYLFDDQAHFRRVVDGAIGQTMNKIFLDKKGNRNLVVTDRMPRHLTTKNREVHTPADLAGLKLRTLEVPVHVAAWKALGANPVPMAFPEVFTALQQGTLDAQENPFDVIFANNFFEVQKYLILTAHVISGNWFDISDKVWQTFSTEEKDLISTAAKDAGKYADDKNTGFGAEFSQKLKDKGMTFIQPQVALFQEKLKDVPNQFKDVWKAGLYDEIRKLAKG
ncbi:MAG: TRAP transporter substrate-binding protein [Chloroflexi bacterium]|nr:TRAP transporter substrate-binding protein [Chloroflexota bacterium]